MLFIVVVISVNCRKFHVIRTSTLSFNMLTNCITADDDVSVEILVLLFWLLGQVVQGPRKGPNENGALV